MGIFFHDDGTPFVTLFYFIFLSQEQVILYFPENTFLYFVVPKIRNGHS